MVYSGLTQRTINTPYQDSRRGTRITTIVLHHMASTSLDGVLSMWINATRQGSANYAIGNEGQIVGAVPEENRSWSLANFAFDAKSITFEIENESTNGWTVSTSAHEATAKVVADICRRYGIACNRTNVLGHREVYTRYGVGYSTACPGGLNLDWIVSRANQLLGGAATAGTGTLIPQEDEEMIRISAPNRGIGLIGPGHYHSLTPEENSNAAAIAPTAVAGNDRQYDLWVAMATQGQSNIAPFNPAAVAALVTPAVVAAIAALPVTDPGAAPSVDAVAEAVEKTLLDNFAALPAAVVSEEGKRLTT